MDYSAHDSDLPGGGDPWASSPKHNRQSFGQPPTSDIPSSPLPAQASPYGQGSEQYGYMGEQDAQNRPNTASSNGDHSQPPPVAGQDATQAQQHHQAQQQAPAQGQQPQRYHGTRPQRQQQHYKLQAKVTGLERNGKKDPILRFDVYVRHLPYLLLSRTGAFALKCSWSFSRFTRAVACRFSPVSALPGLLGNCFC
jgi:hypothetical protein